MGADAARGGCSPTLCDADRPAALYRVRACTVSCAIENQTPHGEFRTTVNQYRSASKGEEVATNVLLPGCATTATTRPACRYARSRPPSSARTGSWWSTTNAAWVRLLRAGLSVRCPFYQSRHPNGGQMHLLCTGWKRDCCRRAWSRAWRGSDHRRYARSAQQAEQAGGAMRTRSKSRRRTKPRPTSLYYWMTPSSRRCRGGRRSPYGEGR